jgi:hypothetical protein
LAVIDGCASTNVTQQTPVAQEAIARPNQTGYTTSSPHLPTYPPAPLSVAGLARPARR